MVQAIIARRGFLLEVAWGDCVCFFYSTTLREYGVSVSWQTSWDQGRLSYIWKGAMGQHDDSGGISDLGFVCVVACYSGKC